MRFNFIFNFWWVVEGGYCENEQNYARQGKYMQIAAKSAEIKRKIARSRMQQYSFRLQRKKIGAQKTKCKTARSRMQQYSFRLQRKKLGPKRLSIVSM